MLWVPWVSSTLTSSVSIILISSYSSLASLRDGILFVVACGFLIGFFLAPMVYFSFNSDLILFFFFGEDSWEVEAIGTYVALYICT